jgi:hypothetical protein
MKVKFKVRFKGLFKFCINMLSLVLLYGILLLGSSLALSRGIEHTFGWDISVIGIAKIALGTTLLIYTHKWFMRP